MPKPKKISILTCPRCRQSIEAKSKFCNSCGRRIGFGIRSENEIRAAINKLDNTSFVINDLSLKPGLMSDIGLINYILHWVVGEEETEPTDMLAKGLQNDDKVRGKQK